MSEREYENYDQHDGDEPPIDVPVETQAMQVRDKNLPPPESKPKVTAAQAKVEAVASLTLKAYERASELKLTPEEIAGLQEDFPDEAFKPGASGKESLIYIEHAFLRDRLNKVFGIGQWAIVPRSRWGEDFTIPANRDKPEQSATRIYVEAMLVVRGCFVAEAIGDMVYYPKNQSQNYGDAVEGAKTSALRRCTKELGIGLQAYKKDWCAGWWERENARRRGGRATQNTSGGSGGSQSSAPSSNAAPAPQSAPRPAAKTADVVPPVEADQGQRFRFLAALSEFRTDALKFAVHKGWITDVQTLEELPNRVVPTTKRQYEAIMDEFKAFTTRPATPDDEAWRTFKMPWGAKKDIPLGELEKKYLFGLFMNYTVETEYNGNPKSEDQIAKDTLFRQMLDEAGKHYDWKKEKP
jgi:hypothetical protein